jgi:hypothetical protein
MRKASLFLAACCAAISMSALAGESYQKLAVIRNDRNPDIHTLSLMVGSGNRVDGIYIETLHNDTNPPTRTSRRFALNEIESPDGVVLDGDANHKAIILQGDIDAGEGRGELIVRYLKNGLFGVYASCHVSLVRNRAGTWWLEVPETGRRVQNVSIRTWSLGIRNLVGLCS